MCVYVYIYIYIMYIYIYISYVYIYIYMYIYIYILCIYIYILCIYVYIDIYCVCLYSIYIYILWIYIYIYIYMYIIYSPPKEGITPEQCTPSAADFGRNSNRPWKRSMRHLRRLGRGHPSFETGGNRNIIWWKTHIENYGELSLCHAAWSLCRICFES